MTDGHERPTDFLTESEMDRLLEAAKRPPRLRDHLLVLMIYRHGLRASEAIHTQPMTSMSRGCGCGNEGLIVDEPPHWCDAGSCLEGGCGNPCFRLICDRRILNKLR